MIVAIERAAHLRMDAVRCDHKLGVMLDAVGKAEFDACRPFLYSDQTMAEMKAVAIDTARQGFEQIGAMEGAQRSAETPFDAGVIAIVERGTRVHIARENAGSDIGRRGNAVAKPDRAQRADRLRADIDPGADLAKARRGFENFCREAEFGKRGRRRQTGKAAAGDGDARSFAHWRFQIKLRH
jgi:hypothetical protein